MAFVDGENLSARFNAMVSEGHQPRRVKDSFHQYRPIIHNPQDQFVWSTATVSGYSNSDQLLRVHYYTTFSGGNDEFEKFQQTVSTQQALLLQEDRMVVRGTLSLIPRVFHKTARNTKTKSVDINLCVDVLEYVHRGAIDGIFLVTGDVDYLPLIDAVMRAGKRVYLAALSSGLSSRIRHGVDHFIPLDALYFQSAA